MSTISVRRNCASLVMAGGVLIAVVCFLVAASKVERHLSIPYILCTGSMNIYAEDCNKMVAASAGEEPRALR